MEEDKKQIMHGARPRKLNLNAPLLSTRRPLAKSDTTSKDTSSMVPFSWERIPGEPKDKETNDNLGITDAPPPPKPPPGRWQPPVTEETTSAASHAVDRSCDYSGVDEGDEEYGHNERFSDAIDIFSLAESIDDTEANCEATTTLEPSGCHSPNFIIQRFLPDAQALAEESVITKKLALPTSPYSNASFSRAVGIRRSYQSPKGCGLASFFPWRMKPKPCSVKSPVCDTIIGPNQKKNR